MPLMAPRPSISLHSVTIFFFFIIGYTSIDPVFVRSDFVHESFKCLVVPSSVFISAVQSTIERVEKATSLVSKFMNHFHDLRLWNAINDCAELLDFTHDELNISLSAIKSPNGEGDLAMDLRAWLSAALGNQDTCLDGFEGTNHFVKGIIAKSLEELTSQAAHVLAMVTPIPSQSQVHTDHHQLPSWMTRRDRRKLLQVGGVSPNVVVAQDGSGNFANLSDAILAAPDYSTQRYVIYVKAGVYKENVEIKKKKWNLMIIGDGMNLTIISGNRNFVDGSTTFRSATFAVSGKGFLARDITFENTAGPDKHQAVALRSDSDLSAFYRCGIHGYQDTLYAHSLRQFYRECQISGTVDFIFGNGAVVFQNCEILARNGLPNQKNTITAHGRKDPNQSTGFSIQFCNITADDPSVNLTATYLGRPWKQYSRTVFMQSYISSSVNVAGWLEWQGNFALDTLYYGEYNNYGSGAGLENRVKWPGYHAMDSTQANTFTVAQFIDGNLWLPPTGVKFVAGLVN